MRYILSILLTLCFSELVLAQENSFHDPQLDKYDLKNFNPAAAAIDNEQVFILNYKEGGFKYQGHPLIVYLSYENFIEGLNSGLGIHLMHEQLGPLHLNHIRLMYNYRINLEKSRFLSFGAQITRKIECIDVNQFRWNDLHDPIFVDVNEVTYFEHDFGVYYENKSNGFGMSICNLFENQNYHKKELFNLTKRRTIKAFGTNKLLINEDVRLYSFLGYQSDLKVWLVNFDNTIDIKSFLLGVNYIKSKDYFIFSFDAGYILNDFIQLNILYQPKKEYSYSMVEVMSKIKIKN